MQEIDDINLDDIDSDIGTLFSKNMKLVTININLNYYNFDEDDHETIVFVGLMAWCNRYKQCKICEKRQTKN